MTNEGQALDANASGLVVVYSGEARAWANVERAATLLREEGLSPVLLDEPDGTLLYASGGTRAVRVGVPPAEAERADEVLAEWNDSAAEVVEEQRNVIARDLAFSFPLGLGAFLVSGLVYGWTSFAAPLIWGLGAWFLGFFAVSNIPGLHQEDGAEPPPGEDMEDDDD